MELDQTLASFFDTRYVLRTTREDSSTHSGFPQNHRLSMHVSGEMDDDDDDDDDDDHEQMSLLSVPRVAPSPPVGP